MAPRTRQIGEVISILILSLGDNQEIHHQGHAWPKEPGAGLTREMALPGRSGSVSAIRFPLFFRLADKKTTMIFVDTKKF
jgi:hypothetical protein